MPTVAPIAVAITPTTSESRARKRMQRPNSSVPSGNSADGLARACGRSCRSGSWGAARPAKRASATRARMTPRPTTARRCLAKRRTPSLIADPWVEPAVEQIHEKIDEDEDHGDQQHAALDDRVVALEDGGHREPAHAGPRE